MKTFRGIILLALILSGWSRFAHGADEIDRLLAAVNGVVITQGDLNVARTLNALLLFGKNGAAQPARSELDRMIDLELVRQELVSFPVEQADESSVDARMDELRGAYAEIGGLPALLARLGLEESELESYVRLQVRTMHFVDLRFRPFVSVSDREIEEYYDGTLVPELRRGRIEVPALREVSDRIRNILIEEKVNSAMDQWLKNIRENSKIEIFLPASASDSEGDKP